MRAFARIAPLARPRILQPALAMPSPDEPVHDPAVPFRTSARESGPADRLADMATLVIIPARAASTRFPGKPLAPVRGADGTVRPLLEWTWRTARAIPGAPRVVIATDDAQIARRAAEFGAEIVLTPETCANGTERCAAALSTLMASPASPCVPDLVINLQGDAPLTPVAAIGALATRMAADPGLAMATPALACSPAMLAALHQEALEGRVGGTTVVFDRLHNALYFSRAILPWGATGTGPAGVHLHLGLYAYRPAALAAYAASPACPLEQREGLEQLRFLDAGLRVGVVPIADPGWDIVECNNPADIPLIEAAMARRGAETVPLFGQGERP